MTSLQWRNFRSNDFAVPLSLEEIYRTYGAWAGIHDFNFNTLTNTTKTIVGITADDWTYDLVDDLLLPANFTVKYHVTDWGNGIVIYGLGILIFIEVDIDGNIFVGHDPNNAVQLTPYYNTPHEADVEVVFRQQTFDDTSGIVWRSVTLYMNGLHMTTYSDYLNTAYSDMQIGFLAFDTNTVDYTNIIIPELGDTVEFGTLDPGEYALGGLQRTIEGRYVKNFIRWNGELRAWKLKQRDLEMVINHLEGTHRSYDLPQLITHARMMGAYVWGEAVDQNNLILYGQRFQEVNNSMLLTQSECDEEAANSLKRSEEATFTIQTQARHIPILEPEDRITIDGEDWVIKTYSVTFLKAETKEVYTCSRYVWE